MFNRSVLSLLVLGFLSACDSDVAEIPNPPSDGPGPGDGGVPGDAPPEPPAITERTSPGTHRCRVVRDRTDHSPRQWGWAGTTLVTTSAGTAYLAREERIVQDLPIPIDPQAPPRFLVGSLNTGGTFGTPIEIPAARAQVGNMTAAPRGDGFALVWVEGTRLRFAAFDGAGMIAVAPRDVAEGVDEGMVAGLTPRMAAGPDGGFGLVYDPVKPNGVRTVQFLVLGPDGTVRVPARRLDGPAMGMPFTAPAPAIVGGPAGYAMLWNDPADPRGAIDFARADAAGAETLPRKRIHTPGGDRKIGRLGGLAFAPAVHGLLEVDGHYLASWVESFGQDMPDPYTGGGKGAGSVVRLVRLDASGTPLAAPASLRAPADSIDEVEPSLVRLGDAVAVLWARGTHIYLCGGCRPDHRVDLLMVDPTDLTPLSDVVSVTNGGAMGDGGLLNRQLAVLGKSLLMTYRLTFHVHNTPGSATFECDRVK